MINIFTVIIVRQYQSTIPLPIVFNVIKFLCKWNLMHFLLLSPGVFFKLPDHFHANYSSILQFRFYIVHIYRHNVYLPAAGHCLILASISRFHIIEQLERLQSFPANTPCHCFPGITILAFSQQRRVAGTKGVGGCMHMSATLIGEDVGRV